MEEKRTDAERIYEEIKLMVSTGPEPELNAIMSKVLEYGNANYQEGIEDAIDADVHPDIEEEMRVRAEEYHEARSEPYQ